MCSMTKMLSGLIRRLKRVRHGGIEYQKNRAKKYFIPIHLRECMEKIPPRLDYLRDVQWIQLLPPATYKSVFKALINRLEIPLDANILEFLRKLEFVDQKFMIPTLPKTRRDFEDLGENIDDVLSSLGKNIVYHMSQRDWEDAVNCAEQALVLVPDDSRWINIR